MAEEYLSVREVASLLHVDANTVRRWVETGKVPHFKIGRVVRIPKETLEDLMTPLTQPPYVGMSENERRAYVSDTLARFRAVAAEVREKCGHVEDSVKVLREIRSEGCE